MPEGWIYTSKHYQLYVAQQSTNHSKETMQYTHTHANKHTCVCVCVCVYVCVCSKYQTKNYYHGN